MIIERKKGNKVWIHAMFLMSMAIFNSQQQMKILRLLGVMRMQATTGCALGVRLKCLGIKNPKHFQKSVDKQHKMWYYNNVIKISLVSSTVEQSCC